VDELGKFDRVVIRSIWDYQHKLPVFRKWLTELAASGIKTLNPPELMQWNVSKRYLTELERLHGIPIVPTTWIERDARDFASILENCPWEHVIVKPEVGAGSDLISVFNRKQSSKNSDEIIDAIRAVQERSAVMLQPFLESIQTIGETSLVFFSDGSSPRLSHVVTKKPKTGDFRVQHERGGLYERIEPSRGLLQLGQKVVSTLQPGWLFARVDVVNYGGQLCLGELEVIEPQLYFRWAPDAVETFADYVIERA
jgi:glutathione synthase/RimK-type ligase-like ATP-grasp enzyme